jgi:hypothetical protein
VRDGEMIAGDLLEEFREGGRGQWWYLRQVASFVWCRETKLALRVCGMWFAAFCVTSVFAMTREAFAPAYGVAVFMFAVPSAGFYLARKTDWFWLALGASILLMFAMLAISAIVVRPPGSFWFPIALGSALASVSALAGKMSLPAFEQCK